MSHCPHDAQPLTQLEEWYASALGKELAGLEEECLERMLRDTFGYYLLQVGITSGFGDAVGASRIRHRILLPVAEQPDTLGPQIVASPDRMPVSSDSVDAVLRYVHFDAGELLDLYQDKLAALELDADTRQRYLEELQAGLHGYTYLED